jgi:hypothetical protein
MVWAINFGWLALGTWCWPARGYLPQKEDSRPVMEYDSRTKLFIQNFCKIYLTISDIAV